MDSIEMEISHDYKARNLVNKATEDRHKHIFAQMSMNIIKVNNLWCAYYAALQTPQFMHTTVFEIARF